MRRAEEILSGARVTALVRDAAASRDLLRALGADDVVEDFDGQVDLVIEGVGGRTFALANEHVAPRGIVVNIATADDEPVTFQGRLLDRSPGASIYSLNLFDEIAAHSSGTSDLRRLCRLVADGRPTAKSNWSPRGASPHARSTPCCTAASAARPCSTSTDPRGLPS